MVDDHGSCTALGLRALAGVVHDEWIQMRQRPQTKGWVISLTKRDAASRQPFEIAVFAEMHDGMRAKDFTNPKIKRKIFRRRRKRRAVINGLRLQRKTARRLNADEDFSKPDAGDMKIAG